MQQFQMQMLWKQFLWTSWQTNTSNFKYDPPTNKKKLHFSVDFRSSLILVKMVDNQTRNIFLSSKTCQHQKKFQHYVLAKPLQFMFCLNSTIFEFT